MNKGFTIYFAILVASLSLTLGMAIYELISRELSLSQIATQSEYAIYAADTGIECALYWDFQNPDSDGSAFATSTYVSETTSGVYCAGADITGPSGSYSIPQRDNVAATTTFTIADIGGRCALVTVAKSGGMTSPKTVITSDGLNTCVANAPLKVQRSLQASY